MMREEVVEYAECRVCGTRRRVDAQGRFPVHRIVRHECPGSLQFVKRWEDQRNRRLVAQLRRRWG